MIWKGAIGIALVVALVVAELRFELSSVLTAANVEAMLARAGNTAPLVFIAMMATAVIVSPIPSLPLDIVAGTVFGPVFGTLYAALGATIGAIISFAIARFVGREMVEKLVGGHINFCGDCSDKLLGWVVLGSRLVPAVSFDLVSYGAGFTAMSLPVFAATTFVGTLPLTFVYVAFGASILANWWVAGAGGLLFVAAFFGLPRLIERHDLLSLRSRFEH